MTDGERVEVVDSFDLERGRGGGEEGRRGGGKGVSGLDGNG